jgi:hypothetical protein
MEPKEIKYRILYQIDKLHWNNKYFYTLEEAESALKVFQDSGVNAELSPLFPENETNNDQPNV